MRNIYLFLSSLRLTVVLLFFSILLVFLGTLDQVHLGIYQAQKVYFESFFVVWSYPKTWPAYDNFFWLSIPLMGGYLLGILLVTNLCCSHFRYFKFSKKKTGIAVTHLGVVLLLISGFTISGMQKEGIMSIALDQSTNYSQSFHDFEIALIDRSNTNTDRVTAIPQNLLIPGKSHPLPHTPFTLTIEQYHPNGQFGRADQNPSSIPLPATKGHGQGGRLVFFPQEPSYAEGHVNLVTALVTLKDGDSTVGTWILSHFFSQGFGPQLFSHQGKEYSILIRPERTYYPYRMALNDLEHDIYPGTTIPKNFASDISITHQDAQLSRDAYIYMNHPLRYEGSTFYQYQMISEQGITRFQVVRNPSWLLPYISVALVGIGMTIQFLMHLTRFAQRRR